MNNPTKSQYSMTHLCNSLSLFEFQNLKKRNITTLGNSLVVPNKTKHTLTTGSNNHTPWYLSKGTDNLRPHKNLYTDECDSFIHNCQNLEDIKISIKTWMIHLDNGTFFSVHICFKGLITYLFMDIITILVKYLL